MLTSGIIAFRSTGATLFMPLWLSDFAKAEAELGRFDDAWRYIGRAIAVIEASKQRLYEADVHRVAGEIALMSPQSDAAKAQAYFERALAVARAQQAKSWELRAAMSRARLWRDQGKPQQARELLAPVYGWFTEGFDTLDLKGKGAARRVARLTSTKRPLAFSSFQSSANKFLLAIFLCFVCCDLLEVFPF